MLLYNILRRHRRSAPLTQRSAISTAVRNRVVEAQKLEVAGDSVGARRLLQEGLEALKQGSSSGGDATQEEDRRSLLNRVGLLLLKQGRPAEGLKHLDEAHELAVSMASLGRGHDQFLDTGGLLNDLAAAAIAAGKLSAAEKDLRRARFAAARAYRPSPPLLAATWANLCSQECARIEAAALEKREVALMEGRKHEFNYPSHASVNALDWHHRTGDWGSRGGMVAAAAAATAAADATNSAKHDEDGNGNGNGGGGGGGGGGEGDASAFSSFAILEKRELGACILLAVGRTAALHLPDAASCFEEGFVHIGRAHLALTTAAAAASAASNGGGGGGGGGGSNGSVVKWQREHMQLRGRVLLTAAGLHMESLRRRGRFVATRHLDKLTTAAAVTATSSDDGDNDGGSSEGVGAAEEEEEETLSLGATLGLLRGGSSSSADGPSPELAQLLILLRNASELLEASGTAAEEEADKRVSTHPDLLWLRMATALVSLPPAEATDALAGMLEEIVEYDYNNDEEEKKAAAVVVGEGLAASNSEGKGEQPESDAPMKQVIAHNLEVLQAYALEGGGGGGGGGEDSPTLLETSKPQSPLSGLWLAPPVYGSVGVALFDHDMTARQWKPSPDAPLPAGMRSGKGNAPSAPSSSSVASR